MRWSSLAAVLLLSAPARAQTAAQSLDELSVAAKPGQLVVVTDDDGRKTRGRIAELSRASLVLLERDRLGTSRRRTFDAAAVARIRRTDSLWNGILIGAGIGVGATVGIARQRCGPSDAECTANFGSALGFALIPALAGLGALVDRSMGNQLLYEAPPAVTGPSASATPVGPLRPRGARPPLAHAGLSVSLRF